MTHRDLTIAQVLKDPLIRQVMRADRISVAGMANLLQDAAHRQQLAQGLALSAGRASIAKTSTRTNTQIDLR
ncbi:hypothetical protein ACQZ6F_00595 [Rhizobium sp. A22-96]